MSVGCAQRLVTETLERCLVGQLSTEEELPRCRGVQLVMLEHNAVSPKK